MPTRCLCAQHRSSSPRGPLQPAERCARYGPNDGAHATAVGGRGGRCWSRARRRSGGQRRAPSGVARVHCLYRSRYSGLSLDCLGRPRSAPGRWQEARVGSAGGRMPRRRSRRSGQVRRVSRCRERAGCLRSRSLRRRDQAASKGLRPLEGVARSATGDDGRLRRPPRRVNGSSAGGSPHVTRETHGRNPGSAATTSTAWAIARVSLCGNKSGR